MSWLWVRSRRSVTSSVLTIPEIEGDEVDHGNLPSTSRENLKHQALHQTSQPAAGIWDEDQDSEEDWDLAWVWETAVESFSCLERSEWGSSSLSLCAAKWRAGLETDSSLVSHSSLTPLSLPAHSPDH